MASTQVEEEPPVQEVTEETTHIPACCVREEKPAAPTEESKIDIHEEEIGEDQEKEEKGEELFKDEEEKVAGSPTISEDKPAPIYDRKLEAEDEDEEDEEDEDESI